MILSNVLRRFRFLLLYRGNSRLLIPARNPKNINRMRLGTEFTKDDVKDYSTC